MEAVTDFTFLDSKITADSDYSHEIKRCLLLGRKIMTNLEKPRLKSKDITLRTKVHIVKTMVFPVIMHRCESWTRKKAEHQRIDAFELQCWRRLWRVPWTARRSNQSILKQVMSAAAAASKSHQSCLTLCDPIDSSPPGSSVPGILQTRTLEWVAISLSSA